MTVPPERRAWVEQVMGLPVSVLVRGPGVRDRPDVAAAVHALHARLHEVDRTFSTYRPGSAVSRLRSGLLGVEQCPPEVVEVLLLCDGARTATGGWFDVRLPDADGVRRLDPSGLVKGWAVERAVGPLRALPGCDWVVNAGGDVLLSGRHGDPWRVGVEDTCDRSRMAQVLQARSGAVATSGRAARGDHVVDPRSGVPARLLASATVAGPSLLTADVQATAALAQGPAALARLEALPGYEALLQLPDGDRLATSGWADYLSTSPST